MENNFINKNSNNPVYSNFFTKECLPTSNIDKTLWRGTVESENSYVFKVFEDTDECKRETLMKIFGLSSSCDFKGKFSQAISGDGHEKNRIMRLHSSSLAALLMFYNVSKDNPIRLTVNETKYTFTESCFEKKTLVHDNHYSNMDVVLRGKRDNDNKAILFLESKFSEYLTGGKCSEISKEAYKEHYDNLGLFDVCAFENMEIKEDENNNDNLEITPKPQGKKYQYCKGIKQMISHYIGVRNCACLKSTCEENLIPEDPRGCDVLLGEVVFKFDNNVGMGKDRFDNYQKAYRSLAKIINGYEEKKQFDIKVTFCPDLFTFQDIMKEHRLDEKVKKFYKLDSNNID